MRLYIVGASLERQLPKLRRKGYSCQCTCITHFGCCIKRKPRENIQVCANVLPTSYRQVTERLPTQLNSNSYRQRAVNPNGFLLSSKCLLLFLIVIFTDNRNSRRKCKRTWTIYGNSKIMTKR